MNQSDSINNIPKVYVPDQTEKNIYDFWKNGGYFKPSVKSTKKPFIIIMPPPNVTGELHMGHALTTALQDLMVRWRRMKGHPTLYLPGTDHAGIATQVVVERMLSKVPRGRFLEVEEFTSLICWLSSEENTFSTAAVFDISGGRSTY